MALYDNKYWLLNHIRNSFISTDDTEMCELVMTGESRQFRQQLSKLEPFPDPESSDDEDEDELESLDLQMDEIREKPHYFNKSIQKIDQGHRKAVAKMKHVKWEKPQKLTDEQMDELFAKVDVPKITSDVPVKSTLTELITKSTVNPYIEYSKFDGTGQMQVMTRSYKIFITMWPEMQRNYPIQVCCISSAKVRDLIGLILLKLSTKDPTMDLRSVKNYDLFITEEDGEVEHDLPCLDVNECISKFGFNCLSLELHKEGKSVNFDESQNMQIFNNLDMNVKKREREIKMVEIKQSNDMALMDVHNKTMEAPLYKAYNVFMVSKMRTKAEVRLGISGDKIEIDPVHQKISKFNLGVRQKPVSYNMDHVAWCQITDDRSSKTALRLVYQTQSGGGENSAGSSQTIVSPPFPHFKHIDFETDHDTAFDIEQKVNLILDLRQSTCRKEYLAMLERKQSKKLMK